jgi:hypothetical protein
VQPADIAIALRRRSPWEAMDLGLSMLQRWWRLVYLPHLIVAALIGAAAFGAAWALGRPWVALLAIWWLKPLNDRVVLHVLSRAVFGERQGTRAVFAQTGQWLRTGLLPYLLFRWWPDMARSFYLPVRQLEGQRYSQARARKSQLGRRVHGYAVWLTLVCMHFELVLYWSLGLGAGLLLPATASEGRDFFESLQTGEVWGWADVMAYAFAVALLEPFYVAAGFALYLNRRSVLEGWDIEVALRRIAERHAAAVAGILILIFTGIGFSPEAAYAQKDPKAEIAEVLKAPEFPHQRDTTEWRWRKPWDLEDREPGKERDLSWLGALGQALADGVRVIFWVAAAALLAYALWWAARLLPRFAGPASEPYRPPESLFGMELAPEKLPADVAAAAAALAAEGKLREALGLLYRGALSDLVHRQGVMLLASHTENEVLGLSPKKAQDYLGQLIDLWRHCAYGRRQPGRAEVDALAQGYRGFVAA